MKYFNLFCIFLKYFNGQKTTKNNSTLDCLQFRFVLLHFITFKVFLIVSFTFAAFTGYYLTLI